MLLQKLVVQQRKVLKNLHQAQAAAVQQAQAVQQAVAAEQAAAAEQAQAHL